ncbi:hypothetical protein ABIB06_006589 [Bradyrhizobium sp. LB8.2]|uniref:hypothetical protein n=1 Tax=unclassified Bradyrhizobium TaxID=2631580 RepID=UPI003393F276
MGIKLFRNWYRCNGDHLMQWTTETPHPVNSPCPTCGLLFFPWASEDMTTAKFKSDNGIVDPPQLDFFK